MPRYYRGALLGPRIHAKGLRRKGYKPGQKYYANTSLKRAKAAFYAFYKRKYPNDPAKRKTARKRDWGRKSKKNVTKSAKYLLSPNVYDYPGWDDGRQHSKKNKKK